MPSRPPSAGTACVHHDVRQRQHPSTYHFHVVDSCRNRPASQLFPARQRQGHRGRPSSSRIPSSRAPGCFGAATPSCSAQSRSSASNWQGSWRLHHQRSAQCLSKVPSQIAKLHRQIVENRLEFQPKKVLPPAFGDSSDGRNASANCSRTVASQASASFRQETVAIGPLSNPRIGTIRGASIPSLRIAL